MRVKDHVRQHGPRGWAGLAILAMLGCASPERETVFSLEEEEWSYQGAPGKILKTANFQIHTTVQDPLLLEIMPTFAEVCYERYKQLMPGGADDRPAMDTYVFALRRQWARFTRDSADPRRVPVYLRIQSGGFTENGMAVLYLVGRERTLSVLAHEGLHQYVALRFDEPIPAWLNEGLASYCEAFEMEGTTPKFTPTRNTFRMNHLRSALTRNQLVPLQELLDTHAGNIIRLGGDKVSTYYAQAWALIVFLQQGGHAEYAAGFSKLLADAGTSRLRRAASAFQAASEEGDVSFGAACFRHYVCEDLEAFNEAYVSFLIQLVGFSPGESVRSESAETG